MKKFDAGQWLKGEVTNARWWLHLLIIAIFLSLIFGLPFFGTFGFLVGADLIAHILVGVTTGEPG